MFRCITATALAVVLATPAFASPKDDVARIVQSPGFKAATQALADQHDRTVQDRCV